MTFSPSCIDCSRSFKVNDHRAIRKPMDAFPFGLPRIEYHLSPFSSYFWLKYCDRDWFKVIQGQRSLCQLKVCSWFPVWLALSLTSFLSVFLIYFMFKLCDLDRDVGLLKLIQDQRSQCHPEAHGWFPVGLRWVGRHIYHRFWATGVTWGPSSPTPKGHGPPIFGPCLLWPNGRPSQLLLRPCWVSYWNPTTLI